MKKHLTRIAAAAALAAGMAFAQAGTPQGPPAQQPGQGRAAMRPGAMLRRRVIQALNLTASQKQQAKAIFQQAKANAQPLTQQLQQNRDALSAAVKANDAAQIQSLSIQQGTLRGQVLAIRSEAMAKFYGILTPDQRATFDQVQQKIKQRIQNRFGNNG